MSPKILIGPLTFSKIGCFISKFWVSRQSFLIRSELKQNEFPEGFQSLGLRSSLMKESTTEFSNTSVCLIYCIPFLLTFFVNSWRLFIITSEFLPVSNWETVAFLFHWICTVSPENESEELGRLLIRFLLLFFKGCLGSVTPHCALSLTLLAKSICRSKLLITSVGIDGASGSKPPWIYTLLSIIQQECRKRWTGKNLNHSDRSVS